VLGALAYLAYVLLTRGPGARLLATGPPEGSATAPATASAPAWKLPTFTARQKDRDAMVAQIERYGLEDEDTLDVMRAVPRHEFVPAARARHAYADTPLPIGHGQTISQPYIVAEMTRLLDVGPRSKVLEVGTGSGYQAAVLAHLTPQVYTVEIIKPLADSARKRLKRLGYTTVTCRHGDGWHGWPKRAPFDAIVVTCAARRVPPPLIKQLKPGGRMIIPVGGAFAVQSLTLVEKTADGKVRTRSLMPVSFVPLLRPESEEP